MPCPRRLGQGAPGPPAACPGALRASRGTSRASAGPRNPLPRRCRSVSALRAPLGPLVPSSRSLLGNDGRGESRARGPAAAPAHSPPLGGWSPEGLRVGSGTVGTAGSRGTGNCPRGAAAPGQPEPCCTHSRCWTGSQLGQGRRSCGWVAGTAAGGDGAAVPLCERGAGGCWKPPFLPGTHHRLDPGKSPESRGAWNFPGDCSGDLREMQPRPQAASGTAGPRRPSASSPFWLTYFWGLRTDTRVWGNSKGLSRATALNCLSLRK